jgi:hypothetical protein
MLFAPVLLEVILLLAVLVEIKVLVVSTMQVIIVPVALERIERTGGLNKYYIVKRVALFFRLRDPVPHFRQRMEVVREATPTNSGDGMP